MKNKKIIVLLMVFTVILTIAGGTLAYWNWQTSEEQKTNVVFTITSNFSCAADGGGNITEADTSLAPATCTNSTYAIKRTVKVTPTIMGSGLNVNMDLWLDVNNLGTGLSNSQNFRYALTTSSESCETGVVSSGNFNGKKAGDKVYILNKSFTSSATDTYYLYIWLDKEEESLETMNQTFNLSLNGSCDNASPPEKPVLDSGMIPVTISDTGVTSTVSKDDSSWYNYSNKEWANAILVKSESRSKYLNTSGEPVDPNDILGYYVWIPRYSYKIWATTMSSQGKEQTIDIAWEKKDDAFSKGSTIGTYITHPAFWFDTDGDKNVDGGETLAGFWVGKFETTGDTTTPTILPNESSLRNQNVSNQFITSLKFSGGTLSNGTVTFAGNDTYGLSSNTNSHMAKNSEWGAVAYLSHSKYGANRKVYINNSSSYYTGRSGGNVGGSTAINSIYTDQTATDQYNSYGFYTWDGYLLDYNTNTKSETHDITKVASTTGNITGVYDMSGGAWEFVTGVLADGDGNPRSGNSTSWNSGFNGLLSGGTPLTAGIAFPPENYYDLYTTTTSTTACNGGVCYGHDLSETANWYGEHAVFVSSSRPWFVRGGRYHNGAIAGVFYSDSGHGNASSDYSFRSVLVPGIGA